MGSSFKELILESKSKTDKLEDGLVKDITSEFEDALLLGIEIFESEDFNTESVYQLAEIRKRATKKIASSFIHEELINGSLQERGILDIWISLEHIWEIIENSIDALDSLQTILITSKDNLKVDLTAYEDKRQLLKRRGLEVGPMPSNNKVVFDKIKRTFNAMINNDLQAKNNLIRDLRILIFDNLKAAMVNFILNLIEPIKRVGAAVLIESSINGDEAALLNILGRVTDNKDIIDQAKDGIGTALMIKFLAQNTRLYPYDVNIELRDEFLSAKKTVISEIERDISGLQWISKSALLDRINTNSMLFDMESLFFHIDKIMSILTGSQDSIKKSGLDALQDGISQFNESIKK